MFILFRRFRTSEIEYMLKGAFISDLFYFVLDVFQWGIENVRLKCVFINGLR